MRMPSAIPEGATPIADALVPFANGWIRECPVCGARLVYYIETHVHDEALVVGCRCDSCHMVEYGLAGASRCGWINRAFSLFATHRTAVVIAEAKIIYQRQAEFPIHDSWDDIDWSVYADWLEECGCPLNAAAVRQEHMK